MLASSPPTATPHALFFLRVPACSPRSPPSAGSARARSLPPKQHLHTDEFAVDTALPAADPMRIAANPRTGPCDPLRGLSGEGMSVAGNSTANGARVPL
jgi:hypothetical protein